MTKDTAAPKTDAGFLSLADILASRRTITVELPHGMGKTQITYNPNKYTEAVNSRVFAPDDGMKTRELLEILEMRIGGPSGTVYTEEIADQLDVTVLGAFGSAILTDFFPTKPVLNGKDGETEPTGE